MNLFFQFFYFQKFKYFDQIIFYSKIENILINMIIKIPNYLIMDNIALITQQINSFNIGSNNINSDTNSHIQTINDQISNMNLTQNNSSSITGYIYSSFGDYVVTSVKLDNSINSEDRIDIDCFNKWTAKYQINKLLIVGIEHKFDNSNMISSLQISNPNVPNEILTLRLNDILMDDINGIDYYLTKKCAFYNNLNLENYTGKYESWHDNGCIHLDGEYINGLKEGNWTELHPNGLVNEKGFYLNGKKQGKWIKNDNLGNRLYVGSFVNDLTHDFWIYYRLGIPYAFGKYDHGIKQGMWIFNENLCDDTMLNEMYQLDRINEMTY